MYLVYFIFYVCFLELVERERWKDVSKPGTVPVSVPCFDTILRLKKLVEIICHIQVLPVQFPSPLQLQ